ncbi:MAG: tRNA-intron lyase [Candidatus Woesearchaeota archaeon]
MIGVFSDEFVNLEGSDPARDLYNKSRFGVLLKTGELQLSLLEALFLLEKGKITVKDKKGKDYSVERFIKRAKRVEPHFVLRYTVFADLRRRGYIVKTALKFGGDFRVYDKGVKPGEDHAKWVVYPVHEGAVLTWYDFAAKNRVAHSTKKRLLLGLVDDEGDVTYYEIAWKRP